jgi:hypothetical protein
LAFRPTINEFNGMRKVEIQLIDWRVAKQSVPAPKDRSPSNISQPDPL